MAWKGRYLVVGFASGDIPRIPFNLPLLKGCSVVGVFWGEFAKRESAQNQAHFQQLFQWYAAGKIKPHIHAAYPLEQAAVALREMMERNVRGKVVLVPAAKK
jgi:NADPH2:quinone reductase